MTEGETSLESVSTSSKRGCLDPGERVDPLELRRRQGPFGERTGRRGNEGRRAQSEGDGRVLSRRTVVPQGDDRHARPARLDGRRQRVAARWIKKGREVVVSFCCTRMQFEKACDQTHRWQRWREEQRQQRRQGRPFVLR